MLTDVAARAVSEVLIDEDRHITEPCWSSPVERSTHNALVKILFGTRTSSDVAYAYLYRIPRCESFFEDNSYFKTFDPSRAVATWVEVSDYDGSDFDKTGFQFSRNGYARQEVIELYIKQTFHIEASVFANKEDGKVVYMFNGRILPKAVLCTIFAVLPELVKDKPLSDKEKELLTSYADGLPLDELVYTILDEISATISELEMGKLKKLFDHVNNLEVRRLRDKIARYNEEVSSLVSSLAEAKRKIIVNTAKLDNALASKSDCNNFDEIKDYLDRNKNLSFRIKDGDREGLLNLAIETTLSNFDSDMYELYRNTSTHWINKLGEDNLKLLDAIFLDEKFRIHVSNCIRICISDSDCSFVVNPTPFIKTRNTIGNPHLEYYNCFGMNEELIADACAKRDFIGMVTAITASVGNINFADGAVFPRFLASFLDVSSPGIDSVALGGYDSDGKYSQQKFIENILDGTMMTPQEAIEYLKKGEEKVE